MSHHFISKEIIPSNAKPHEYIFVDKHNGMSAEFTELVGVTDKERRDTIQINGWLRGLKSWAIGKRFRFMAFIISAAGIEIIAQGLGIPTKQFWPLAVKLGEWMVSNGIL